MGILSNSSFYLCGQIENCDSPIDWRVKLAQDLKSIDPTFKVWDPLIKPDWVDPDMGDNEVAYGFKPYVLSSKDQEEQNKGFRCFEANVEVRNICAQLAGKCDILIARISKTFTWGSIDELELAAARGIPIFLWLPDGNISIYGIAGVVRNFTFVNRYVHESVEPILRTLKNINEGNDSLVESDPETWMYLTWKDAGESYA